MVVAYAMSAFLFWQEKAIFHLFFWLEQGKVVYLYPRT